MAYTDADIEEAIALWQYSEQQADPRSDEDLIVSGLREEALVSCQYWIKGLSPLCTNWDDSAKECTYVTDIQAAQPDKEGVGQPVISYPTGYNNKNCDYLGKRSLCSKYTASGPEDLDKYWCIAPNIFLSGLGTASGTETSYILSPIPYSNIAGYCGGRCDERGRGTGCNGIPGTSPVICKYYRPWQMGFGAIEPHQLERTVKDDGTIEITDEALEAAYGLVGEELGTRLPYSFKVYNLRAYMQKCAYWDSDYGSTFSIDNTGVKLDGVSSQLCTNTEEAATPYYTLATEVELGVDQWLLQNVWSQAHTVICNGAKPECPCYTGKWDYVTDVKMVEGMRIGVNQLFELRFYASAWGSQEEYEGVFEVKPNWEDVTTADIYTFDKWHTLSIPSESIMQGKKFTMCMPAAVNQREFLPDKYITKEILLYKKAHIKPGTTAPNEGQIYFPTLIRDPDTDDMYVKPIDIIYPYATIEPFGGTVYCEGAVNKETYRCIKRGISLEGDSISVIGSTVRNREIYAFNLNYFDRHLSEFYEYSTTYAMPDESNSIFTDDYAGLSIRERFFVRLEELIEEYTKVDPLYVFSTTSDSVTGYFQLGPIPIKYQEENTIVVCVYYESEQFWDFRVKKVLSKFYGGALVQTNFDYEGATDVEEEMPEKFSAGASIAGKGYTFIDAAGGVSDSPTASNPACVLGGIKHVGSNKYIDHLGSQKYRYNYCIKKVTETDVQVDNWARVGNHGVVWAEIEDLDLNNIFEWEVISAKMVLIEVEEDDEEGGEDATDSSPVCIDEDGEVALKVKEIETWVTGQSSIPPSVCVLEPEDDKPRGFFNSDWTLKITYWYKEISDNIIEAENEEVVWPSTVDEGAFSDTSMSFVESSLELEVAEDIFTVEGVSDQTVSLMGYFNNEEGRLMSCMASKMLVQVVDLQCRNVEIFYSYASPAEWCRLMPETSASNLAITIQKEICLPLDYPHTYIPWCGDHKKSNSSGKGSIWFPFDGCETTDYYREYSGAAFCTADFPGVPRDDMRFCGPSVYKAWVDSGSASAYADCVLPFHYRYSVALTGAATWWAGYANIVSRVNILEYIAAEWDLPPFGNKGRDMVEKWFSQEHWIHTSYKNSLEPYVKEQWVPIVPDKEHFFLSFNAFEESSGADLFSCTSQLNFMTSQLVKEDIETDGSGYKRYRFDEVFGGRGIWRATYPPPLVIEGDIEKIVHYYFQDNDMTWAWRDYWQDIEYIDNRKFFFVDYEKPDYVYDYEKMEHRYICAEDEYVITYTAPLSEEGQLKTFPSIKLGDGQARYFEIRYDSYDSSAVDWKDDNEGEVDASGGDAGAGEDEGGHIYEKASGSDWSHDENILFDNEAVDTTDAADAAGRKREIVYGDYTYYNRGIIANITRDKLQYLPYGELAMDDVEFTEDLPYITVPNNPGINKVWYDKSPTLSYTTNFVEEAGRGVCVSKIVIKGMWGIHAVSKNAVPKGESNEFEGCLPGITITGNTIGGASNVLYEKEGIAHNRNVHTKPNIGLKRFTFTILLQPTPSRMMLDIESEIQIKLDCFGLQYIFLDEISMTKASYIDSTEIIKVYERKYVVSRGSDFGDVNINGPSKILHHELDMDNSGVYYPIHPDFSYITDDPVNAKDKMRAIYAGEQYREEETISDQDTSTIVTIETEEQKNIYNNAIAVDTDGDTTTFTLVGSPSMKQVFNLHNIPYFIDGTFVSKCVKLPWEEHYLVNQYVSGEIWHPQGHKYQWGQNVINMKCYDDTPSSNYGGIVVNPDAIRRFDVYEVVYIHMDNPDEETPTVDVYTALYFNRIRYQIDVVEKFFGGAAANVDGGLGGIAASTVDDLEYVGP